jgi:MoaA/NifB/PqqE/SkfB family radical SAM enzyme
MNKLTLALDMAGCPNRCKHCWIGISPNGHLKKEDLYYIAREFRKITNNLEVYSWYREPDFLDNYKKLFEIENELSNNRSVKHFELLSYWRAVRDEKYVPWLKKLGVNTCQLTLWGNKKNTDYYVGRNGAYEEILQTIDILLDNRIIPRIQIFINKDTINELGYIADLIVSLNIEKRCKCFGKDFSLFLHQGSCDGENIKLYDKWITKEDVNKIPLNLIKYTLKHFQVNNIIDVFGKTEYELYEKLIKDKSTKNYVSNDPVFYIDKDFYVYPNISNISSYWLLGNINNDSVEKIAETYNDNKSIAQNISVTKSICEIVEVIGDEKSQRLFSENDYRLYLLNKYCEKIGKNKNCA